jgi:hypothetical protein
MTKQYYFDHAASAPRRDAVTDAMARWQHGVVGNPSGSHKAARDARRAVEEARDEVGAFVGREARRCRLYRRWHGVVPPGPRGRRQSPSTHSRSNRVGRLQDRTPRRARYGRDVGA